MPKMDFPTTRNFSKMPDSRCIFSKKVPFQKKTLRVISMGRFSDVGCYDLSVPFRMGNCGRGGEGVIYFATSGRFVY